jgi:hypothetical protein
MRQNPPGLHGALVALLGATLALSGCFGGGGSDPAPAPAPAPTQVSGVAATGAPLAGATVTLIDASATTADPAPQTAGSDGRYSFVVDGLQAPFTIKVGFTRDGTAQALYSVLLNVVAGSANTANVTPLSNAVAVLVAPGGDPAALEVPAQLVAATSGSNANAVANAVATINTVLASDPTIQAALAAAAGAGQTFDPVTTPFVANGSGVDGVLDQLTVTANPPGAAAGTVEIQNNAQAAGSNGVAPPVTVTQATTPATAPTLPPTASGDLPSAADLDAFAKLFNDCYALPAGQRVTAVDANGAATAIAPLCDFAVADFKSNGYNWIRNQGPSLLNANNDGAVFQRPVISLVIPPLQVTDPKETVHPYCDQSQCVVVDMRVTLPAANNQTYRRTYVLAKTGGSWKTVGNQRPYDMDIQLRLNRLVNQNATPIAPTSYFSTSRYEGILRLALNPLGPGGINDVRAVRITGPGLPAAGVVLSRSARCTSDRFAIVSKTGDTYVIENGVNVPRYWTNNASNDFKFGAANLDGSEPAGWPSANVDYADALGGGDDIQPWGVYKWEIFLFGSATPAVPDRIHRHRLNVLDTDLNPYVDSPSGWWASLSAANLADYLQPGGSQAGALTDVSLSWTVPSSLGRVDSAYLFGQNNVVVNGTSYNKRTILFPLIAKPGETTASVTGGQSPWVSGVSTSTYTSGIVAAQNPRCSEADKSVVALSGVTGDYREAGVSSLLANGVRLQSIFYWSP